MRSNPFRSLQYLPWTTLFQSAGVAIAVSALVEFLVFLLLSGLGPLVSEGSIARPYVLFFISFLPILLAFGLGALALAVTARLFRSIPLRKDTMWALVACVLILLPFKNLLVAELILTNPFQVSFSVASAALVAAGVFVAGRRYWSY